MNLDNVPRRTPGIFTRRSGGVVLLEGYIDAYEANDSAAFLWGRFGDGSTVRQVADALATTYSLTDEHAQRTTLAFADRLVDLGFLQ